MKSSCFKFSIALIVILMSSSVSYSQIDSTESEQSFQVFAYSASKGIMLIIVGDWILPAPGDRLSGYYIYRKENETDSFQKITPLPLAGSSSYSDMTQKVGQGFEGMFPVFGVEDSAQFWQLIVDQDESITVWGALFKKFRAAMGQLHYDYDVVEGRTYTYSCTKTDASGNESPFSLEISATAGVPLFSLLGPIDVNAEPKNNGALITWKPNSLDSAAFSYNVYRAYDSLGSYTRLNSEMIVPMNNDETESEPEMSFVDTLAVNGRSYYYTVVSVDYADNESARENIVSVYPQDVKPPAVPKNIKAESGNLGISIKWEPSSEEDIAGYALYRSDDPDSAFVKIDSGLIPLNAGRYEDVTAQSGDEYFYRLTAVDQAGNESEQSANIYGYFIDPSLPLPPMDLKVKSDSDRIVLTWSKVDHAEVMGYYVFRTDSYKGEFTQVSDLISKDDTLWVDTASSLSSYGTYYYAMKSSTLNGNFSYYNEAVAVAPIRTDIAPPEPPSDFFGYADFAGVRLHWKMPLDKSIYGYNVYRTADGDTIAVKLTDSLLFFSTTTYFDSTVQSGRSYSYYIKSAHFGGIEGIKSHEVAITPIVATPEPPDNLRAVAKPGLITFKWDKVLLDNMKGYNIYKHTGGDSFEKVNKEIINLEISEFIDRSIIPSQIYYCYMTTVSEDNRESSHSKVINVLSK